MELGRVQSKLTITFLYLPLEYLLNLLAMQQGICLANRYGLLNQYINHIRDDCWFN